MNDDTTPIPPADATSGHRAVSDPDWVFPTVGPEPDPVYPHTPHPDGSSYFYNPVSAQPPAAVTREGITFPNDDWLGLPPGGSPPDAYAADTIAGGPGSAPRSRVGRFFAAAALVVAGVVGGAAVVNAVQGSDPASLAGSIGPGGQGQPGQQGQGQLGQQGQGQLGQQGQPGFPPGGVDGERRLLGVVTAVGDGTITLRAASGRDVTGNGGSSAGGATETYAVTSSTEVGLDGAQASLADFAAGDIVLAHVLPQQANGHPVLERLLGRSAGGLHAGTDDTPGSTSGGASQDSTDI